MTVLDELLKAGPIAVWGAVVATGLAAIKIWEVFVRDRTRLATTYFWTGQAGEPDTITVVNLGPIPLMASHWELKWEPKLLSLKWGSVDVTPYWEPDDRRDFKLGPHETWTAEIPEGEKFNWGKNEAEGRRLVLHLHVFGRKNPLRLVIT